MTRIFVFALASASLFAQYGGKKFSWQDSCFNNPGAPYCQGHDFAVKKNPKNPKDAKGNGTGGPLSTEVDAEAPSVITVGGIDWHFADPSADALVGFDLGTLSTSPLGRAMILQLAANQGVSADEMNKTLERLSGIGQVVISVHNGRSVALATGTGDAAAPALEAGWKTGRLLGGAMLVGHEDAVDEALERIATRGSLGELVRLSKDRQSASDFWAIGSSGTAGADAGLKRFALSVSVRSSLATELALQFDAAPSAKGLLLWPELQSSSIQGGEVYQSSLTDAAGAQEKLAQFAKSPLGQSLAAIVTASRYLPVRNNLQKQNKPVIYGLDDGPKVIGQ